MIEIRTVDRALSPRPLIEVLAAESSRSQREDGEEGAPSGIFTSGETHWSADVGVRLRLADVSRQEAKRHRLLELLARPEPLWDPVRHPELDIEGGAAAWVKKLRHEAEEAFEKHTRGRDDE
jgi:hypothetical protein